jgi:hypothetical protein
VGHDLISVFYQHTLFHTAGMLIALREVNGCSLPEKLIPSRRRKMAQIRAHPVHVPATLAHVRRSKIGSDLSIRLKINNKSVFALINITGRGLGGTSRHFLSATQRTSIRVHNRTSLINRRSGCRRLLSGPVGKVPNTRSNSSRDTPRSSNEPF